MTLLQLENTHGCVWFITTSGPGTDLIQMHKIIIIPQKSYSIVY